MQSSTTPLATEKLARSMPKSPKSRAKRKPKARTNGEGTLFQRKNGTWVAKITVSIEGGKQKFKSMNAKTQEEASRKLKELTSEASQGIVVDGALTVGAFLNDWGKTILPARNIKANTIENYHNSINSHIVPAIGNIKLSALKVKDVEKMLQNMAKKNMSHSTMRITRSVLIIAIKYAEQCDMVPKNVASLATLPRGPKRESRAMTEDQAKLFLESARGHRLEAAWVVMLVTGLRTGECLGLEWDAIDLKSGTLRVKQALVTQGRDLQSTEPKTPRKLVLGAPKTPKSNRTIALPNLAIRALRSHKDRQAVEIVNAGDKWNHSNLVFTGISGKPINPSNFRRSFVKVTESAGLGHWHPHELRHTAVSLLSAHSLPLQHIADMAGHSSTRMTGEVYRHSIQPSVSAHVAPMDAIFK
ncbi:MAG: site-specific integrase [Acidimicrobiales bacterium]|nr:site-specific integrase [Acidimicrobiales bacterium]